MGGGGAEDLGTTFHVSGFMKPSNSSFFSEINLGELERRSFMGKGVFLL